MTNFNIKVTELNDKGNLKGLATVRVGELMEIKGIRILENKDNELFVSYPSKKTENGDYFWMAHPTNEMKETLNKEILAHYHMKKSPIINATVKPVEYENSKLKAYATVTIENCFIIENIKLFISENDEPSLSFPNFKITDNENNEEYKDYIFPTSKESYSRIKSVVLDEYNKQVEIQKSNLEEQTEENTKERNTKSKRK